MTAKDYWLIVRVIRVAISRNLADNGTHNGEIKAKQINEMVLDFERELLADNSRFDRDRFRRAIYGKHSLKTI